MNTRATWIRSGALSLLVIGLPIIVFTKKAEASNPIIQNGLKIDICKTADQDDDYVCESTGAATNPFVEVNVSLPGPTGPTHTITLSKNGDGDIKIEPNTFQLECGKSTCVKVWGLTKSSAKDSTKIDGFIDGVKNTTENMTVFVGVKLKFEGTFYSPIDGRDFLWRPHDGFTGTDSSGSPFTLKHNIVKSDPPVVGESGVLHTEVPSAIAGSPTAAEIAAFKAAVHSEDTDDNTNRISFIDGDQAISKRAWSRAAKVTVSSVWAKDPTFEMTKDELKGADVWCSRGSFKSPADLTAGSEEIVKPVFELKNSGNVILKIFNNDAALDTSLTGFGSSKVGTAYGAPAAASIPGQSDNFFIWFTKWNGTGHGLERPVLFPWVNPNLQSSDPNSRAAEAMHYENTKNGGGKDPGNVGFR